MQAIKDHWARVLWYAELQEAYSHRLQGGRPPPAKNDPFLVCPSRAPSLEFTRRHAYERPQPPAALRKPPKRAAGAHRGTHAPASPRVGAMSVGWRGAAGGGGGNGGGGGGGRSAWSSSSWTSWTAWTWAATWSTQWQSSEGRLWTQSNEAMPEYVSLENYVFGLIVMFVLGVVVGAIGPMRMIQRLCGPWPCAPANVQTQRIQMEEKSHAAKVSSVEHVRDVGTQSDAKADLGDKEKVRDREDRSAAFLGPS